jgi:hypothetical protein
MTTNAERLKRGSYPGRWEVYIGETHIGWVTRHHRTGRWLAFVNGRGVTGRQVGWDFATRREAVGEVWINRYR